MAQNWKYKKKDVIFKEGSFKPIFMSYEDCVNIMLGEARNLRNKKKKNYFISQGSLPLF